MKDMRKMNKDFFEVVYLVESIRRFKDAAHLEQEKHD